MPIFEYRCRRCGQVTEILSLPGRERELRCGSCGADDLEKLLSAHNTTSASRGAAPRGGCCGDPGSCGTPGSCCPG